MFIVFLGVETLLRLYKFETIFSAEAFFSFTIFHFLNIGLRKKKIKVAYVEL